MTSEPRRPRRFKLEAEVTVEVTDIDAVERSAVEGINSTEFDVEGLTPEKAREEERQFVIDDPGGALSWLADPDGLLPPHPAIEVTSSMVGAVEVDEHDQPIPHTPDFTALFNVCHCGQPHCGSCSSGYQLAPRTAAVLWQIGQYLGDLAYDDVIEHGDKPIERDQNGDWGILDEYPRLTWNQDAVWRRQAARCFDDLVGDLAAGDWPQPRCAGEEMALMLMLRYADSAVRDEWIDLDRISAANPSESDDLDFELEDVFMQDTDILDLFDAGLDGIEDPDDEQNRKMGIGDYRPQAWFTAFNNMDPRNPGRPFRR